MSKSSTVMTERLPNPHPGEILLEEFLKPMALSQNALANPVHVPPRHINEIVLGKSTITTDTDLRLARYFALSEGVFPGLQMDHDLMQRRREINGELTTIRPRAAKQAARLKAFLKPPSPWPFSPDAPPRSRSSACRHPNPAS